jgi:hypothetical protein
VQAQVSNQVQVYVRPGTEVHADVNLGGAIDTFSNGTLQSLGAILNKDDMYGVYATRRF